MAPRTVIGAASPVDSSGEDISETLYRKVVEDMKAQVRGTADRRGEEAVELAEAMIEDARAVSASEALEAGLIDAVAADLPNLLNQLDGLEVALPDRTVTLQTAEATQTEVGMSFIEQLLLLLTNPFLLGVLLTIGVQAILIELSSPGGWVAGLIGILCIGLALYGIGQLPANWLGLGLIILAFVLFAFEVKTPGTGGLALAGTITLLAGILVLFNSPGSPEFARISLIGAFSLAVFTGGIFLFVVTKVASAQRKKPQTGKEGLIGQTGRVRKTFVPRPDGGLTFTGSVLVMGELWQAEADTVIESGDEISVSAVDGFTLKVDPISTKE
jgi:membrane-bound serine protease (ClpP class)